MFNKNLFNCIKLSTNDLDDNSIINDPTITTNPKMISNTQQWSISLRNKLKKKFNSSLKRIHRKQLDKSANKDSGLNLSETTTHTNCSSNKSSFVDSNLLSSTKYNSTTIDYLLHEGFFSDYSDCEEDEEYEDSESDESFSSLSSLSSIGSLEAISISTSRTLQEKKLEFKFAKQTRFHPLISSSKVSLDNVNNMKNVNDSISSDFALQRKLTPFKTSSRKSLLLSEQDRKEAQFKLTDEEDDDESINLSRITTISSCNTTRRTDTNDVSNVLNKCYSFYFNSFDLTHSNQALNEYNTVCSSTLCKGKRITFNEFIKNEIYSNYFL